MKFTKMHGAGNDFIIIDGMTDRLTETEYSMLAASICRRRLSVGADGMIVVLPASDDGDYSMLFFNSDGSLGEMCGNGARCIAKYGYDHNLAGVTQRIETTAGLVTGQRIEQDLYCVRLNDPTVIEPEVAVPWEGQLISCSYIELGDPGIPHAIVHLDGWDEMDRRELRSLGSFLRSWDGFTKGANVTFWTLIAPDHVKTITFERGVEDFTLACGTGAGSTAVALYSTRQIREGQLVLDFPGGELTVALMEDAGKITDLFLTGPAVTVAEGEFLLN